MSHKFPNPNTNLHHDMSERLFIRKVQYHAMQTIDNVYAGCTLSELRFIHVYYITHQRQRFTDAIIQCTYAMLEALRSSELQR